MTTYKINRPHLLMKTHNQIRRITDSLSFSRSAQASIITDKLESLLKEEMAFSKVLARRLISNKTILALDCNSSCCNDDPDKA